MTDNQLSELSRSFSIELSSGRDSLVFFLFKISLPSMSLLFKQCQNTYLSTNSEDSKHNLQNLSSMHIQQSPETQVHSKQDV